MEGSGDEARGAPDDSLVHVEVAVPAEALRRATERAAREGESLNEIVGLALALYALGFPISDDEAGTQPL
jgi:hypothetical protein